MLTLAMALPVFPASADPIFVTGGSATAVRVGFDARGATNLHGTHQFDLQLFVEPGGFGPWLCFPCVPGTSIDVGGSWGFGDGAGTVELNGVSYRLGRDVAVVGLRFVGDPVIAPDLAARAVLSVPFELGILSQLLLFDSGGFPTRFPLVGRGTATIELVQDPGAPVWDWVQARYEFAPVPEPATLLLVGTGVLALSARRYRRR
jgi:hypothetical protein